MSLSADSTRVTDIERKFDEDLIANHVLEPGDLCCLLGNDGNETGDWGVVVKSAVNSDRTVEVRLGSEPCRIYPRTQLRWLGPLE